MFRLPNRNGDREDYEIERVLDAYEYMIDAWQRVATILEANHNRAFTTPKPNKRLT